MKIKKIGMQKNGYGALHYGSTENGSEEPKGLIATIAPPLLVLAISAGLLGLVGQILSENPQAEKGA